MGYAVTWFAIALPAAAFLLSLFLGIIDCFKVCLEEFKSYIWLVLANMAATALNLAALIWVYLVNYYPRFAQRRQ